MLHLHFLGSPEVWFKQQLLTFPTRKTLALLIYLAVEKGLHPREKLQTLLWPDNDSTRGRGALRTTLAYLRRAVETTERNYLIIEGDALGFNFNSDFQLDLDVANQANQTPHLPLLETTIKLYRGDFLEGFSLPDAPAFDEWASRQQEYWHRHISLVFTRLSQLQSEARQFEAGIATAIRWVAQDSLNETAYRRLMQFYLMAGQRPAALQVYESCR
ncbi:MAG: BTAD domain-containing putative transcriptional regulator, partial [Anaerolineae bacterium]